MKRLWILMVFAAAMTVSGLGFAQENMEATGNSVGDDKAMTNDVISNEVVNDEGYGNDEEYYGAEEGDHQTNAQGNFEHSEQNNTPMNPENNAPSAP